MHSSLVGTENCYIDVIYTMIILKRKNYSIDRSYARATKDSQFFRQLKEQGERASRKTINVLKKGKEVVTGPLKEYGRDFKRSPLKTIKSRPLATLGAAVSVAPVPGSSLAGIPLIYGEGAVKKGAAGLVRHAKRSAPYMNYVGMGGRMSLSR